MVKYLKSNGFKESQALHKQKEMNYLYGFSTFEKNGNRLVYPVFVRKRGAKERTLDVSLSGKSTDYEPMKGAEFIEWLKLGTFADSYPNASVRCAIDASERRPDETQIHKNGYSVSRFYSQVNLSEKAGAQSKKAEPDDPESQIATSMETALEQRLSKLSDLDNQALQSTRKEQQALRRYLLKGKSDGHCVVCNQKFPADLLVAAHLKQRSKCNNDERLNFSNVVALMCKLGCDDLYEKGYILVDDGYICKNPKKELTIPLAKYIENISGLRVANWERGKNYYQWHSNYHRLNNDEI